MRKNDGVVSSAHLDRGKSGVVGKGEERAFETEESFAFAGSHSAERRALSISVRGSHSEFALLEGKAPNFSVSLLAAISGS